MERVLNTLVVGQLGLLVDSRTVNMCPYCPSASQGKIHERNNTVFANGLPFSRNGK